jgi:tetratricopeptide (TPR) repeat protein
MLTTENSACKALSTLAGLILLFATGCAPSGPKALLQGEKYLENRQYEKALRSFNRAADLMPNQPQVWNHLGLAYHGLNQPQKAAQAYEQALRLDRNLAPARYNLGMLHLEQGRLPEAINELASFTTLQPNEPLGWKELGKALVRAKRPDEAERALTQGLKLTPKDAELHNQMGLVHMQRKRPREAIQSFNAALQNQPGYGPALLNQAIVAQQYMGNKPAALERYKAYLGTNPRTSDAVEVARIVSQLEEELTPKPVKVAAAPTPTPVETPVQPAKSNVVAEANPATTQPAIRPKATNPPPIQVAMNVNTSAVHVAAAPRTNAPVVTTKTNTPVQVIQEKPRTNAPPKEVVLAKAPDKSEEPQETLPPIEVVQLNNEPQIKAPIDTSAAVAQPSVTTSTNSSLALKAEEKPLFAPRKKEEKSSLGKLNPANWFKKDENAEAPPKTKPEPSPKAKAAETPAPKQEKGEAATPIRVASTVTRPGYVPATPTVAPAPPPRVIARYPYRKNLTFAKGKHDEAGRFFQEGAQAQAEKNLPGAIAAYKRAIALDPSFFNAYYNLGLAALESKDLPLALATDEEAVALNPDSVDARYNFALALRDAHYYIDAAFELREILGRSPDDVRVHLALGNLYAQYLDEPKLAQQHYARVLELNPNHREAQVIREWLASQR